MYIECLSLLLLLLLYDCWIASIVEYFRVRFCIYTTLLSRNNLFCAVEIFRPLYAGLCVRSTALLHFYSSVELFTSLSVYWIYNHKCVRNRKPCIFLSSMSLYYVCIYITICMYVYHICICMHVAGCIVEIFTSAYLYAVFISWRLAHCHIHCNLYKSNLVYEWTEFFSYFFTAYVFVSTHQKVHTIYVIIKCFICTYHKQRYVQISEYSLPLSKVKHHRPSKVTHTQGVDWTVGCVVYYELES